MIDKASTSMLQCSISQHTQISCVIGCILCTATGTHVACNCFAASKKEDNDFMKLSHTSCLVTVDLPNQWTDASCRNHILVQVCVYSTGQNIQLHTCGSRDKPCRLKLLKTKVDQLEAQVTIREQNKYEITQMNTADERSCVRLPGPNQG